MTVSSICTFDIYQYYFKPLATDRQLIWFAHAIVIGFGFISAAFATGLYYIGISMGYLYLLNGIIISPAVLPAALTLLWGKQSMWAATLSPVLGLCCSLTTWLLVTKFKYDEITVASTGQNLPMLCGNVVALCSPAIFIPLITWITGPDNYNWRSMRQIQLVGEGNPDKLDPTYEDSPHHNGQPEVINENGEITYVDPYQDQLDHLEKTLGRAKKVTICMALILLVVWPMPFFGTGYIFSEGFFTGWVYVSIAWLVMSTFCVSVYPIYESRKSIKHVIVSFVLDMMGRGSARRYREEWEFAAGESSDNVRGAEVTEGVRPGNMGRSIEVGVSPTVRGGHSQQVGEEVQMKRLERRG